MPQTAISSGDSHAAKRSAAIFSALAAAIIALLKLLTGLLTGSLGMLSEAAHSTIDLIASGITLFSVQVSDRPADEDHNYGHGKVESLAAFVETGIMFISCAWIVYEALGRILDRSHLALRPSLWPFAVLFLSLAVDYSRSRALGRIARLHRSDALAADSVHFATDLWATCAVLIGLAATYAGQRLGHHWLEYADPIAALVVAGVILRVSWRLAHQTIDALLDATPTTDPTSNLLHSPAQAKDQLRLNLLHDLTAIPGVLSVERLRTRRSGADYFADVTLGLPRNLTFQRSEQLTLAATQAVQRHLPGADVVVHTVPTAPLIESVHDRIRAVAARRNLAIHEISVQQVAAVDVAEEPTGTELDAAEQGAAKQTGEQASTEHGAEPGSAAKFGAAQPSADRQALPQPRLLIEQHLEVDETMPLRQAHELVTDLEAEIRREIPAIASILTHIESEPATIERPASLERNRRLELRLRHVAAAFPEILDIHEVYVTRRGPATIPAAHENPAQPTPGGSTSDKNSQTGGPAVTGDRQPSDGHTGVRIQVSCHCTLPDDLPMGRVHDVITAIEGAFKLDAPEVDRLLIHPEPATDNRR